MVSLDDWGVIAGIVAAVVAAMGLVLAFLDRRDRARSKPGPAAQTIQNFYMTSETTQPSSGGDSESPASAAEAGTIPDDVNFVLLLDACIALANDLYLVGFTYEVKQRVIKLIKRHLPELQHDASTFVGHLDARSPGTSDAIARFLGETLPEYVAAMLSNLEWLEFRSDGTREDQDLEDARRAIRNAFTDESEQIRERLQMNREYLAALAQQKHEGIWRVLEFDSPAEFEEYMQPTMRSLTSSPGDLAEDTLRRLLSEPLSVPKLREEGLPPAIRVELMNRLLGDKWATISANETIVLTDAGRRLLRQRLADWA